MEKYLLFFLPFSFPPSTSFPSCLYTAFAPGFMLVGCDQKDPLSHLGTSPLHISSCQVHTYLLFYPSHPSLILFLFDSSSSLFSQSSIVSRVEFLLPPSQPNHPKLTILLSFPQVQTFDLSTLF